MGDAAIFATCYVANAKDAGSAIAAFGSIDIVINNAGRSHKNHRLMDVGEDAFQRVYHVNVLSIFHMTKAIMPPFAPTATAS